MEVGGGGAQYDDMRKTHQQVEATMPHSREEEERGYHIAEEHVCAACLGIVDQWSRSLATKEQHRGGRRLSARPPFSSRLLWPESRGWGWNLTWDVRLPLKRAGECVGDCWLNGRHWDTGFVKHLIRLPRRSIEPCPAQGRGADLDWRRCAEDFEYTEIMEAVCDNVVSFSPIWGFDSP